MVVRSLRPAATIPHRHRSRHRPPRSTRARRLDHIRLTPALLAALCDTLVPATRRLRPTTPTSAPCGPRAPPISRSTRSWPRSSRVGTPRADARRPARSTRLGEDFVDADPGAARRDCGATALTSADTRPGALILQSTILAMFYTVPDEQLTNPTWPALGFPGSAAGTAVRGHVPQDPAPGRGCRTIRRRHCAPTSSSSARAPVAASPRRAWPMPDSTSWCSRRARTATSPTFLSWRPCRSPTCTSAADSSGRPTPASGMLAGSTVGGGTTVNSMACLPTPDYVLDEWTAAGMVGSHAGRDGPTHRVGHASHQRRPGQHRAQPRQPDPQPGLRRRRA